MNLKQALILVSSRERYCRRLYTHGGGNPAAIGSIDGALDRILSEAEENPSSCGNDS